ncbi:MAG: formylglycine-generating enzyme family protein [Deltaproteobacteria bacterium]|nr:formylglycine-generating enzyme family protein [Deltaproteobacteria bacterium]
MSLRSGGGLGVLAGLSLALAGCYHSGTTLADDTGIDVPGPEAGETIEGEDGADFGEPGGDGDRVDNADGGLPDADGVEDVDADGMDDSDADVPPDEYDVPPEWCTGEEVPCAGAPRANEICVPGGSFLMGSPDGFGDPDEWPQHTVWVGPFFIDRYEVTNRQYRECVADGYCPDSDLHGDCLAEYRDPGRSDYPFHCSASLTAVDSYCRYWGGRLPTEAEWEKAARGTDGRTYPWGEETPTCDRVGAALEGCPGELGPVGSHPGAQSPYGVDDMASGVGELVLDSYCATTYLLSPPWCDPCITGSGVSCTMELPEPGGGCLSSGRGFSAGKGRADFGEGPDPTELRAANRDDQGFYGGFRCVRPAPTP